MKSKGRCVNSWTAYAAMPHIQPLLPSPPLHFVGLGVGDARCHCCKLISTLAPALMKTHLFVLLTVCDSPVQHARGVFRFAAQVFKRQNNCHEWMFRRLP